jgi:hypothetical protein
MRRGILALCLTLAAGLTPWSASAAPSANEISETPEVAVVEPDTDGTLTLEIFEAEPMELTGCRISCNTDFNIFCTSDNPFGCSEGLNSTGYYIQCDSAKYYCPACPSWDPQHCLD